ncbi:hypothetical protein D3C81_2181330 [compost metagenome]
MQVVLPVLERLFAIVGQFHGAAKLLQLIPEDQLVDDVVFGDQYVQAKLSQRLRARGGTASVEFKAQRLA